MAQGQPNYTMGKMLRASAEAYGPSDAVVFPDDRRSYDELYRAARVWAKGFVAAGVKPGEHVGILLPTRIDFFEILFGLSDNASAPIVHESRYEVAASDNEEALADVSGDGTDTETDVDTGAEVGAGTETDGDS